MIIHTEINGDVLYCCLTNRLQSNIEYLISWKSLNDIFGFGEPPFLIHSDAALIIKTITSILCIRYECKNVFEIRQALLKLYFKDKLGEVIKHHGCKTKVHYIRYITFIMQVIYFGYV